MADRDAYQELLATCSKDASCFEKLSHLFAMISHPSFLQAELDALPFQALILDSHSVILMVNAVWRQAALRHGYNHPDFGIGANYLALCEVSNGKQDDEAARVAQGLRSLIAGTQTEFRLNYPCPTPDQTLWYEMVVRSFNFQDQLYLIMFHRDVTDVIQSDLQRVHTQYLYELLAMNIPSNSIFLFDKTLRYTLAEGPNIADSGMKKSDFIGKSLYDLFPKEVADRDTPILQAALEGVTTVSEVHYGDVYYEVKTLPVRDIQGEIVGGMVLTQDITERKKSEDALREKERLEVSLAKEQELHQLKNRMMYRISHEFRTPLTVIQSSNDLLNHYLDRMTPELRLRHFNRIMSEITQLTTALDDISFLVRNNRSRFQPVEVNLHQLCEEILDELRASMTSANHPFSTTFSDDLPPVLADYNLLKSIITNLLSNAVKYSNENTTIHLRATHSEDEIAIAVIDQGFGMNEEERQRLCEPFFRGTNIGERKGMGLGMSIVREALELHDGRMEVESERGKGTTITVYLPNKFQPAPPFRQNI